MYGVSHVQHPPPWFPEAANMPSVPPGWPLRSSHRTSRCELEKKTGNWSSIRWNLGYKAVADFDCEMLHFLPIWMISVLLICMNQIRNPIISPPLEQTQKLPLLPWKHAPISKTNFSSRGNNLASTWGCRYILHYILSLYPINIYKMVCWYQKSSDPTPLQSLYGPIYIYITKPCVNSENCLVQVPDPLDIAGASGHLGDVGEPTTVGNGILYNRRRHYAKGGKRH